MAYHSAADVGGHRIELHVLMRTVFIKVDGQYEAISEPDKKVRTRIALKALGMWKEFLRQAPEGVYYCTPERDELRELYVKAGWTTRPGRGRLVYEHKGFDEGAN